MNIDAVSQFAMQAPLPAQSSLTGADAGRQFDAMVWRMLLESGAFPGVAGAEDGEWSVLGGVLTQVLADDLAAHYELGFGRLLLTQAGTQED